MKDRDLLPWTVRLERATGYRELGMLADAEREIAQIAPADQEREEVLAELMTLATAGENWTLVVTHGKKLVQLLPEDHRVWLGLAVGVRHTVSLDASWRVLEGGLQVVGRHPSLCFEMACHASQMENFFLAKSLLNLAIRGDHQYRAEAMQTKALRPLWDHLNQPEECS